MQTHSIAECAASKITTFFIAAGENAALEQWALSNTVQQLVALKAGVCRAGVEDQAAAVATVGSAVAGRDPDLAAGSSEAALPLAGAR